jgi:hypothetical protein
MVTSLEEVDEARRLIDRASREVEERLIEGDADPAPAEAWVLFTDRHVRQLFIRADVQGSF